MSPNFNFDIENLSDIEIVNRVNGRLYINGGMYVPALATVKLSSLPMSVDAFKKAFPTSALIGPYQAGAVSLNAIVIEEFKVIEPTPDENPITDETTISLEAVPIGNPFGDESTDLLNKTNPDTTKPLPNMKFVPNNAKNNNHGVKKA